MMLVLAVHTAVNCRGRAGGEDHPSTDPALTKIYVPGTRMFSTTRSDQAAVCCSCFIPSCWLVSCPPHRALRSISCIMLHFILRTVLSGVLAASLHRPRTQGCLGLLRHPSMHSSPPSAPEIGLNTHVFRVSHRPVTRCCYTIVLHAGMISARSKTKRVLIKNKTSRPDGRDKS